MDPSTRPNVTFRWDGDLPRIDFNDEFEPPRSSASDLKAQIAEMLTDAELAARDPEAAASKRFEKILIDIRRRPW